MSLRKCPNCSREYAPDLPPRKANTVIQEEFPNATPMQREQLITGICSDKCWNEYLGGNGDIFFGGQGNGESQ